jgi:hypothetical protein
MLDHTDRHRPEGYAVEEIDRSVEGIDDPTTVRTRTPQAPLFSKDIVACGDAVEDDLLRLPIGATDEISPQAPLPVGVAAMQVPEVGVQELSGRGSQGARRRQRLVFRREACWPHLKIPTFDT